MAISEEGHKETITRWSEELKADKKKNEDLALSIVKLFSFEAECNDDGVR